jgi:hypothetical protein
MKIDLHIYRPKDIDLHGYRPKKSKGDGLAKIIQQAWETGAEKLCLVHGHGRSRGGSPGFYNTKTGRFGLAVRRQLRHNVLLRQWIKHTTLDCRSWGDTTVKLKANPAPSRFELDWSILPAPSFPDRRVAREEIYGPWLPRRPMKGHKNQQLQELGPSPNALGSHRAAGLTPFPAAL